MARLRKLTVAVASVVALVLTAWATAALYFDSPFPFLRAPTAVFYLAGVLAALWFLRRGRMGMTVAFAGFAMVTIWWLSLEASNDRDWQPDNAKTAYADINGDQVIIHDLRSCTYRTESDYTCEWQTRSHNLANLSGIDLFITWWGSPWIAHPIISFDFGDEGHLAMSIETRDVVGQGYSAIRGFFRQYTLTYIISDERDVARLRTNYRHEEEVYLFRTAASPTLARKVLLDYLQRANSLHLHPEWYNALTNNCTTNIAGSVADARNVNTRLDWRILLNGKMDEMMYEHNELVSGGLSLPALKEQAHINSAAKAADDSPEFSNLIRQGRVGFSQ
jgi:hypothetical protein